MALVCAGLWLKRIDAQSVLHVCYYLVKLDMLWETLMKEASVRICMAC